MYQEVVSPVLLRLRYFVFASCVLLLLLRSFARSTEIRPGMQRRTFRTPDLTEEEEHSPFLPKFLRCDGCKAVAHLLFSAFDEFNREHRSLRYDLPESEILDLTEKACGLANIREQGYGIKDIEGTHRLSGPGLEAEHMPGVIYGGGRWSARVYEMCGSFIEEVGETSIYDAYRRNPRTKIELETFLCNEQSEGNIRGSCHNTQKSSKEVKTEL